MGRKAKQYPKKIQRIYVKTKYAWCDWQFPERDGYLLKCCDCGLVHEVLFAAIAETNRKGKSFGYVDLDTRIFGVKFKVRRRKAG